LIYYSIIVFKFSTKKFIFLQQLDLFYPDKAEWFSNKSVGNRNLPVIDVSLYEYSKKKEVHKKIPLLLKQEGKNSTRFNFINHQNNRRVI